MKEPTANLKLTRKEIVFLAAYRKASKEQIEAATSVLNNRVSHYAVCYGWFHDKFGRIPKHAEVMYWLSQWKIARQEER